MNAQGFRQLMRLHPAAVNIIASGRAPQRTGMTVTAFMSLGVEPPSVVCAVNRNAFSYGPIAENQLFSINTLAVEHIDLARLFAGQTPVFGDARFDDAQWDTFGSGSPCLKGAVISLECRLLRQVQESTHCLLIGEVMSGRSEALASPLLYRDGQWHASSSLETRPEPGQRASAPQGDRTSITAASPA